MGKKTRARGGVAEPPRTRRGGRRPGTWDLVDPDQFRSWRQEQRLSRARLATALGVSATSIQNWETGNAIPSRRYQERLAELMKSGLPLMGPPARGFASGGGDPAAASISALGPIVAAYLQSHQDLSEDQLVTLIRAVRQALS